MGKRNWAAALLLAAAAMALASVMTTYSLVGQGKAVDPNGRIGEFSVEAAKIVHRGDIQKRGFYEFATRVENHQIRIRMETLEEMSVVQNRGQIVGPGVMRVQTGTNVRYTRGRAYFIGVSNRHPGETGERDRIAVHFVPLSNSDANFHYEGTVSDGDVGVATTESY